MMFEAYKVGVKLSIINHVSPVLAMISGQFIKTDKDAKALQDRLKSIKILGATGAAIGTAGFMGLGIIGKMVKPATEYAHQLALMNTAGMKHLEIVKATKAAWDANKVVPTASTMENLAAVRELRMVFRNSEHAIEYMPTVQKIQSILETVRHGEGKAKAEAYELAKALEMKGAVKTPDQFVSQADMITKAIVASGGKVGATDFMSTFKYGRAATSGWNDDFAYKILPTLIQEMKTGNGSGGGSGGPGNALMSAYAAVVGGTITQRSLKLWQQLGLVDPSKAVWTKDGHLKGVSPGGIRGSEMFQASPYDWTQKILIPALQKAGYATETQQKQALQYLFPNRTAGFVMTQFATQPWKFEGDKKIIEQAKGLESYEFLLKNDPVMAQLALQKQWQSMLAILGYQIMPPLLVGITKLIDLSRGLSGWFKDHSTTTKILMWSFVGLSAAMAFGGTVMMLTAAFKGVSMAMGVLSAAGAAGGIPMLIASLVGKGGLVVAAGMAGYAIGTVATGLINKAMEMLTGEKGATLGGKVWDWTHDRDGDSLFNPLRFLKSMDPATRKAVAFGLGAGQPSQLAKAPFDTVRPGGNKQTQIHTQINLDGRQVATVVSKHQANAADRPQAGISSFDMLMAPVPVGF